MGPISSPIESSGDPLPMLPPPEPWRGALAVAGTGRGSQDTYDVCRTRRPPVGAISGAPSCLLCMLATSGAPVESCAAPAEAHCEEPCSACPSTARSRSSPSLLADIVKFGHAWALRTAPAGWAPRASATWTRSSSPASASESLSLSAAAKRQKDGGGAFDVFGSVTDRDESAGRAPMQETQHWNSAEFTIPHTSQTQSGSLGPPRAEGGSGHARSLKLTPGATSHGACGFSRCWLSLNAAFSASSGDSWG
mmetsp:Transcript_10202/g.32274  ORF Transcript_10202/g.32274 Transcript_10202/m.32274 type:complete len:251 (-) Transcript_10202:72-824(-)